MGTGRLEESSRGLAFLLEDLGTGLALDFYAVGVAFPSLS